MAAPTRRVRLGVAGVPPSFKLAYEIPWQVAKKKLPKFCVEILILPRID